VAIKFDLSTIPFDATVVKAVLSLYCFDEPWQGRTSYNDVFRLTREWDESSVTWYKATSNVNWTAGGGDHDTPRIFKLEQGAEITNQWANHTVTSAVQHMVQNPEENHGFLFVHVGTSGNNHDRQDYRSSEFNDVSFRPKLTVEYSANATNVSPRISTEKQGTGIVVKKTHAGFMVSSPFQEDRELSVSNMKGRKLFSCDWAAGHTSCHIPLHGIAPGMHVVSVTSRERSATQKVFLCK
jgi:hypothetical protein